MKRLALVIIVMALAVSACGRKGPLQRVSGSDAPGTSQLEDQETPTETLF